MMTSTPILLTSSVSGLLAMAFLTLTERKILSYSQLRKGPNKPSFMALPQPVSDALKLLSKELILPMHTNKTPFLASPLIMLLMAMFMWSLLPIFTNPILLKYSIIMFLCLSSLTVYATLSASWTSNSKYSLLGSTRNIAQTISYEVSMALIMINMLQFLPNYNFNKILFKSPTFLFLLSAPLAFLWFTSTLAELNRAPFDLIEGESELVSGFNTEFSSSLFTMIFMAEYVNIMFMSALSSIMMINLSSPFFLPLITTQALLALVIIMARSTYPRIRYDILMTLNWVYFLPITIISISVFTALA